tara:strand:- start:420 stop:602 length:183 start_codon:yes stop_codon:yes gene_type:complete
MLEEMQLMVVLLLVVHIIGQVVVEVVHTEVNKVMLVVLVVEEELELVEDQLLEEQEIHLL